MFSPLQPNWKRTIGIGFCATVCATTIALADPPGRPSEDDLFPDVPAQHWARPHILLFAQPGIVKGDSKGRFNGNAAATRQDLAVILDRRNSRLSAPLTIPQWDKEQKTYLTRFEFAVALSRLEPLFRPQHSPTTTVQNATAKPATGPTPTAKPKLLPREQRQIFPDVPPNHWAYFAANYVGTAGVMEGDYLGRFYGDKLLTRYELVVSLMRSQPSYGCPIPLQGASPQRDEPK